MALRRAEADILEKERGLDPELLVRLGIESASRSGSDEPWIMIPYIEGGRIVNRKYRTIGERKEFYQQQGGKQIFWNVDVISDPTLAQQPLIVTEGECDALAAIQAGFVRTVSVPNGAPAERTEDEDAARYQYLENAPAALKDVTEIILAVDNDNAGANLLHDLSLRLGRARCKWVRYPIGCKDLGDALRIYSETEVEGERNIARGQRAVTKTIEGAQWMYVDGVYRLADLPPLPSARQYDPGIPGLNNHYRLRLGDFTVVIGIPGHGKSAFVDDVMCRMVSNYGWDVAVASFEQTPQRDHRRHLREWYNGKYEAHQTPEELDAADGWINRNFVFLVPGEDDDATLEWLLERLSVAVVRYGVKMVVVDPWNHMDHDRPQGMTETDYTNFALKQFIKFARKHQVHFMLVTHPRIMRKDDNGRFPVPTLYDANGSSNFYNRATVGIVVHRIGEQGEQKTLIRVAKSKHYSETGEPGDLAVRFDPQTRKYDRWIG